MTRALLLVQERPVTARWPHNRASVLTLVGDVFSCATPHHMGNLVTLYLLSAPYKNMLGPLHQYPLPSPQGIPKTTCTHACTSLSDVASSSCPITPLLARSSMHAAALERADSETKVARHCCSLWRLVQYSQGMTALRWGGYDGKVRRYQS